MKVALLYHAPTAHVQRLSALAQHATFALGAESEEHAKAAVHGADVIMGNWYFAQAVTNVDQAALRWVQSNSVGMDRHLAALHNPNTVLCNARGLYDAEIADHTLALALACVRDLHGFRDDQRARVWRRRTLPSLSELPALVVGLGGVGKQVARRLASFGGRVRVARQREALGGEGFELVDWRDALTDSQLLILAVPLTHETRGMLGERELRTLPRGAIVINTSRGGLIDEAALVSALADGHLRAAGLDVFGEEPLNEESALWDNPRCVMTPHVARSPDADAPRWLTLFEENFSRFVSGKALLNVVDRSAGY